MKSILLVCTLLFSLSAVAGPFQKSESQLTSNETLALFLLRGTSTTGIYDDAKVAQVVSEIELIQKQMPTLKDMTDYRAGIRERFSQLYATVDDKLKKVLIPQLSALTGLTENSKGRSIKVPVQGTLIQYDVLKILNLVEGSRATLFFHGGIAQKAYPTEPEIKLPLSVSTFMYEFSQVVDTEFLINQFEGFSGSGLQIQRFHAAGNGDEVSRVEKPNGDVAYLLTRRSGDCPAGCGLDNIISITLNLEKQTVTTN